MTSVKIIIEFDRQTLWSGGKFGEMKPEILIVKHDGDDFPVVIEPWGVERTDHHNHIGPIRSNGDGKVRELVTTLDYYGYKPDVIARRHFHSKLIAYSPEMYVALKNLLQMWDKFAPETATVSGSPTAADTARGLLMGLEDPL